MGTKDIARFERKYPGCSNEPPWWPSKKVVYREEERMEPACVNQRGPKLPILIATHGKNTLAYWSIVLQSWEIILP